MRKSEKARQKHDGRFYKVVPTIVFALAGLFYLVSPYEIKLAAGLDFGNTAEDHIIFGVVFLAMAGVLWWFNHRKRPILP